MQKNAKHTRSRYKRYTASNHTNTIPTTRWPERTKRTQPQPSRDRAALRSSLNVATARKIQSATQGLHPAEFTGRPMSGRRPVDQSADGSRSTNQQDEIGQPLSWRTQTDQPISRRKQAGRPFSWRRQTGGPINWRRQNGRPISWRRQTSRRISWPRQTSGWRKTGRPIRGRRQTGQPISGRRSSPRPGAKRLRAFPRFSRPPPPAWAFSASSSSCVS